MGAMGRTTDPEPRRSQLNDAIFSTVRGGFRILGGMVQMAAGITRLVAVTAIKAAAAAEGAVEAKRGDEVESEPEPKPRRAPRRSGHQDGERTEG
jgi:hypothetical protein